MYSCIMDLVEKCIEPQYLHYSYLLSQILNAQKYGFHLKNFFKVFLYAFFMSNWLIFHHLFSIHFSWLGLGTLHGIWKSQKSRIQHCERSELRLHFEWPKVNKKNTKNGQVLPDGSLLIGQKLVENAKIEKFKCDFCGDF